MPGYRYIKIPESIILKDPDTGEVVKGRDEKPEKPITLKDLLLKVMHNPKWNESFHNIRSAQEILKAYDKAKDGVMVLAEEDWKKLEDAVLNPKQVINSPIMGPQTQPGFGFHPAIVTQLIPLLSPIVDASQKSPEEEAADAAKKEAEGK